VPQHIRRFAWITLVIVAAAWFTSLHSRHLIRTDEGRYASIAREMATSGDYVTPTLNGLKYFYKPPLQYWATAIAFNTLGETPLAARLWGAVTAFLAVIATWYTLRRLATREIALAGFSIHASMMWVFGMAHINTLDSALAAFLHLALCAFLLAHQSRIPAAQNSRWLLISVAMAALAVMSKGLIGLLIPLAVVGLYIFIFRQWSMIGQFPWLRAALVFFAITAPWFVLVAGRNAEFNQFFFVHEHFQRFTSNVSRREGAWWYFVPLLIAGLLPWTGLALALVARRTRAFAAQAYVNTLRIEALLVIWCVFIFLFFSVSGSKLPSYILPMFGALALLLAPIALRVSSNAFVASMFPIGLLGIVMGVASLPQFVEGISTFPGRLPLALEMAQWLRASALCFLFIFIVAWIWKSPGERIKAILAISALSTVALWAGFWGYNRLAPAQSGQSLAQSFIDKEGQTAPQVPFYSIKSFDHTLPFYLRRSFIVVDWRDELDLGLNAQPDRFVATEVDFLSQWSTLPAGYAVMDHGVYKRLSESGMAHRFVTKDIRRVIVGRP
jgi:Aminoarabinose transferase C-terminal domain/Dolichyl-phosphate-mannose-protein mannosyltransferase